jgi:hypothetical protein
MDGSSAVLPAGTTDAVEGQMTHVGEKTEFSDDLTGQATNMLRPRFTDPAASAAQKMEMIGVLNLMVGGCTMPQVGMRDNSE